MKKCLKKVIGFLGIVIGISLYSFPIICTQYVSLQTKKYIKEFEEKWDNTSQTSTSSEEKDEFYQEILDYNQSINENGQADFVDAWSYVQSPITLKGCEDGKFGYIRIPAMDVKLPLYIGASENNMKKGAAVLGQTSIPIGGENTNSVIAGHRGYSGIPFFREIEKLSVGDSVIITNPWEKLKYKVESIAIISPYDSDAVKIQEGKDMVTLITCHPYRSHGKYRYVVYCVRDKSNKSSDEENTKQSKKTEVISEDTVFVSSEPDIQREQMLQKICAVIIILAVVFFFIPKRTKKQKAIKYLL